MALIECGAKYKVRMKTDTKCQLSWKEFCALVVTGKSKLPQVR